jgi:hypothetical protein
MTETYIALAAAGGGGLTQLANWYFGKKKNREELKGKVIDNEIKLSDYYKELLDNLSVRYEEKYRDVVMLYEKKERILNDEIDLLHRKIKMLKQENVDLRKKLKEYES